MRIDRTMTGYILRGKVRGLKVITYGESFNEVLGNLLEATENQVVRIGKVMTAEEAEDLFYKTHDCLSDDVDKEMARIERWCEEVDITITD